jgi:phospholipase/carboxylesterase
MLVAPDRLIGEIAARPPVLLIHGEQDPVVPFEAMDLARRALEALAVPVMGAGRPGLDHSIDDEGLAAGIRFVSGAFGKKQV